MFFFRPREVADHAMKRLPIAPPALYRPFALAIVSVVVVVYSGSPGAGKLKNEYHPGWPIVLPIIDEE